MVVINTYETVVLHVVLPGQKNRRKRKVTFDNSLQSSFFSVRPFWQTPQAQAYRFACEICDHVAAHLLQRTCISVPASAMQVVLEQGLPVEHLKHLNCFAEYSCRIMSCYGC